MEYSAKELTRNTRIIKLAFRAILGREISDEELAQRIRKKFNSSELLEELVTSKEFLENDYHKNKKPLIKKVYEELLHRCISDEELQQRVSNWQPAHKFIDEILSSKEYNEKKEAFKTDISKFLGPHFYIVGEFSPCSVEQLLNWYKAIVERLISFSNKSGQNKNPNTNKPIDARPQSKQLVIITSMYKGGEYIESFLKSIVEQTVFSQCQLYIIDANSPGCTSSEPFGQMGL